MPDEELPEEVESLRDRVSAAEALREARAALARTAEIRARLAVGQEQERRGSFEATSQYTTQEQQASLRALGERNRDDALSYEAEVRTVERLLDSARRLDPASAAAAQVQADLAVEQWRRARLRADPFAVESARRRAAELDVEGRHARELRGRGRVRFCTTPTIAEVHLYRHVEQRDVVPDGESRLVPVPWRGNDSEVAAGQVSLRVIESREELVREDLVLEIAGHPVDRSVFVVASEDPNRALRGDRVVRVRDVQIESLLDLEVARGFRARGAQAGRRDYEPASGQDGDRAELVLDSSGEEIVLTEADVAEARIVFGDAARLARAGDVEAKVRRGHETRIVTLPEGLWARATALPLPRSGQSVFGQADGESREIDRGSYVALLLAEGYDAVRLPFVLESDDDLQFAVELVPEGRVPADFVRIPAGEVQTGGDPLSFQGLPELMVDPGEFWIQDHELSCEEYFEFLRDTHGASALSRVPRDSSTPRSGYWPQETGRPLLTAEWEGCAVSAVSYLDAEDYVRWRNLRAEERGEGVVYALPTEAQWEKAAAGAERRAFAFGDRFVSALAKGRFSRSTPHYELQLSYPTDESVYGVFDLTGNLSEYVAGKATGSNCVARGGNHSAQLPAMFRCTSRFPVGTQTTSTSRGLRIVLTLR